MASYSDVRIVTSEKGFKAAKSFIAEYLKNNNISDKEMKEMNLMRPENLDIKEKIKSVGGKRYVYYGWNSAKWEKYSFKDVDAVMKSLDYLESQGIAYHYVRIGDEDADIENIRSVSDPEEKMPYLSVEKTIQISA